MRVIQSIPAIALGLALGLASCVPDLARKSWRHALVGLAMMGEVAKRTAEEDGAK